MSEAMPEIESEALTSTDVLNILNEPNMWRGYEIELACEDTVFASVIPGYADCSYQLKQDTDEILKAFGIRSNEWRKYVVDPVSPDEAYLRRMRRLDASGNITCGEFLHAATLEAVSLGREKPEKADVRVNVQLSEDIQAEFWGEGEALSTEGGELGWQMIFRAMFKRQH